MGSLRHRVFSFILHCFPLLLPFSSCSLVSFLSVSYTLHYNLVLAFLRNIFFCIHHIFFSLPSPSILFWNYTPPSLAKTEMHSQQACFIRILIMKNNNKNTGLFLNYSNLHDVYSSSVRINSFGITGFFCRSG